MSWLCCSFLLPVLHLVSFPVLLLPPSLVLDTLFLFTLRSSTPVIPDPSFLQLSAPFQQFSIFPALCPSVISHDPLLNFSFTELYVVGKSIYSLSVFPRPLPFWLLLCQYFCCGIYKKNQSALFITQRYCAPQSHMKYLSQDQKGVHILNLDITVLVWGGEEIKPSQCQKMGL